MNITYTLKFYSEWHCGSGLAAGADLDALVIKDKNKLPYVPGKTIKGLIREAVENILLLSYNGAINEENKKLFVKTFGNANDEDWNMLEDVSKKDKEKKEDYMRKGETFFTNAELDEELQNIINREKLESYLYRAVSSTAIAENGVAKEHSLRRMETVVPCELTGTIIDVPDEFAKWVKDGLKYIKRLGQNRNRGLGRCDFIIGKEEKR